MIQRSVITIGNFDGVHLGHQALVRHAREIADQAAARVIVMAFDPHPTSLLRPGKEPPRLTMFAQRETLLKACGAAEVIRLTATPALLDLSPEEFIQQVVLPLAPIALIEGPDFHFGKGRAGTPLVLQQLGENHGFSTHILPPIEVSLTDQVIVPCSSSRVRWLLGNGRIADVAQILGRFHTISGTVVQGDRRGRTIGIPTVNLATEQMLPGLGVYAGVARLPDGRCAPAAISVSSRPTFAGVGVRLEAHVIDIAAASGAPNFAGLPEYGWPIELELRGWIRDDLRLPGLDAIKQQIARDIDRVRAICAMRA